MTALADVAHRERATAHAHLNQLLDALCHAWGLDPWETWRRPRLLATIDAQTDLRATIRASAQIAQGLRPRDRHGRYTSRGE